MDDPEQFLDEMFRTRHGLLTVRTMAALSREVYGRMLTIEAFGAGPEQRLLVDAVDQFDHLSVMADGQKDYLQGTIEFYQARTNTKMTIAAERLAVIAAITLPITALSSVLGMNLIVNHRTHWVALTVVLLDHAGDVGGAAGLGQTQGLVLGRAPAGPSASQHGRHEFAGHQATVVGELVDDRERLADPCPGCRSTTVTVGTRRPSWKVGPRAVGGRRGSPRCRAARSRRWLRGAQRAGDGPVDGPAVGCRAPSEVKMLSLLPQGRPWSSRPGSLLRRVEQHPVAFADADPFQGDQRPVHQRARVPGAPR